MLRGTRGFGFAGGLILRGIGMIKKEVFFFEKKNQKTLALSGYA
jgi:hypothetical protein